MSVYNSLLTRARCPWCGKQSDIKADFRFGLRDLREYRLGDKIVWEGRGVRTPSRRPPGGNYTAEAYSECPNCGKPFWLRIVVQEDLIAEAQVDLDREEYPDQR